MAAQRRLWQTPCVRILVLLSVVVGCHGAAVDQAADTSGSDTSGSDTSASDAGCTLTPNLVTNGDFSSDLSGWGLDATKAEIIPGPCGGKGVRLYDLHSYGSITRPIFFAGKKGQRVRIRAWFRASGTLAPSAPLLWCGFPAYPDGGEGPEVKTPATDLSATTWKPYEASLTLDSDVTGCTVVIASGRSDPDEFAIAQVSFALE